MTFAQVNERCTARCCCALPLQLTRLHEKGILDDLYTEVWSYARRSIPHKLTPLASFTGHGRICALSSSGRYCLLSAGSRPSTTGLVIESTLLHFTGPEPASVVASRHPGYAYCYDNDMLYYVDRNASEIVRVRLSDGVTVKPVPLPFGPQEDFVFKVYSSNGYLFVLTMGGGAVYRYSIHEGGWIHEVDVSGSLKSFDVLMNESPMGSPCFVYVSGDDEVCYVADDGDVSTTIVPGARLSRLVPGLDDVACVVTSDDSGESVVLVHLRSHQILCRMARFDSCIDFVALTNDRHIFIGHNDDKTYEVAIFELL